MRAAAILFACASLLLAACEDDRLGQGGISRTRDAATFADAQAPGDASADASAPADAIIEDAFEDAATADAIGFEDADAPPDAIGIEDAADMDADLPDSGVVVANPGLLVADPVANAIVQLDPSGTVVNTFPSPINAVSAVAFDRRARDGFWIAGTGTTNPLFTKLDFSGAVVATHDYAPDRIFQLLPEGVRSLDYGLGATLADDAFIFLFTNDNGVDVVAIGHVMDVGWSGETSINLQLGFRGVHVNRFSLVDATQLDYWTTKDGNVEDWSWAGSMPSVSLPSGVGDIGGVDLASDGTFFITDRGAHSVVHLDAMGAQIGSPIMVPASALSDLSLIE